jgi:LysM repeat protein
MRMILDRRRWALLCAGWLLEAVAARAASYTVKAGDTLSGIAAKQHVSLKGLLAANQLKDADVLRIGQKLIIPGAPPAASAPAAPAAKPPAAASALPPRQALPPDVKKRLDAIRVIRGKWKYVVIHHSATDEATLKSMDDYHRRVHHMVNGLAYHFVIGNGHGIPDGRIEACPRWLQQIKGGHVRDDAMNEKAIGICLVGNFEKHRPTAAQEKALYGLVQYLEARCAIPKAAVKTHRAINIRPTQCPGRYFSTTRLSANI